MLNEADGAWQAKMFGEMSRLRWKSSKRRVPKKASRMIRLDQRSPVTLEAARDRARALPLKQRQIWCSAALKAVPGAETEVPRLALPHRRRVLKSSPYTAGRGQHCRAVSII